MNSRAFITGVSGPELSAAEREFIRSERPWGFILFKRNIETPAQVIQLVQRIAEEHWRAGCAGPDRPGRRPGAAPRPAALAGLSAGSGLWRALRHRSARSACPRRGLSARLIAADLAELGITVDCLPLADVPVAGADAVIGNRAYGTEPDKVAAIARAVTEGLEQGGVLPVLKHIPGHGRATADTHFRLPVVDTPRAELERTDFAAFQPLADLPMAMTAHVVFSALDPAHPATTSATIIEQVIRGVIGFQGLLMSDDVSMNALGGIDRRADPSHLCGRLRHGSALQRQARRNARGRRARRRNCRARRWSAPGGRWRRASRRSRSIGWQARAELDALIDRAGTAGA